MSNWRPIETLSDYPYFEQVLVRKPSGVVRSMKALIARRPERGFTEWMPAPESRLGPKVKDKSQPRQELRRPEADGAASHRLVYPCPPPDTPPRKPAVTPQPAGNAPPGPQQRRARKPAVPTTGRIRDDAASRLRLLAYYTEKELELRRSAERLRATMTNISDGASPKLSAVTAKHLDARADELRAKGQELRARAGGTPFDIWPSRLDAGDKRPKG